MPEPLYRPDFASEIRSLRQAIDQAWVAARTRPAMKTIESLVRVLAGGAITAENSNETPVVSIGTFNRNDGVQVTGLAVRRAGGQEALMAAHDAAGAFTLLMRDDAQQAVVETAADGLTRPYLPVAFYRSPSAEWVSITSVSAVPEFTTSFYRQHTHLRVTFTYSVAAGGTSLGVDLYDEDNAEVLISDLLAGPSAGEITWTVPIPGHHMDLRTVSVRCARAGAAAVAIQMTSAHSLPGDAPTD